MIIVQRVSSYNTPNRSATESMFANCSMGVDHGIHASNSISRQRRHPPGHNSHPVSRSKQTKSVKFITTSASTDIDLVNVVGTKLDSRWRIAEYAALISTNTWLALYSYLLKGLRIRILEQNFL